MSLLITLIVGALIGGGGGFLLQENFDLLVLNILMGIAGAILGGAFYFFAISGLTLLAFSWTGTLCALVGAMLFVLGFSVLHLIVPGSRAEPSPDDQE